MNELAMEYNENGEWLDPGCIMRGAPDENGTCQPSANCPSCNQQREIREEEQEKQNSGTYKTEDEQ